MTDKEERRFNPDWCGQCPMSSEAIGTCEAEGVSCPHLAPKHTDEEYWKLKRAYDELWLTKIGMEVRIKELEEELSTHGACNFLRGPIKSQSRPKDDIPSEK
jgi:hypothetical protein